MSIPGSNAPFISIIVPVLNMADTLGPCLESVLGQEGADVELIVVDGGSTDRTVEVIARYADRLAWWVSERDRGQSHALNKGFDRATGEVLAWLNADEEYLPGVLAEVQQAFARDPRLDFAYGYRLDCDAAGEVTGLVKYPCMHPKRYTLYYGHVLPSDASFWRRRVHAATGRLDEGEFAQLAMDYDWFLRMGFHVGRYRCLRRLLSKFRHTPTRKTANAGRAEIQRLWQIARDRALSEHAVGRGPMLLGWLLAGTQARLEARRFSLPRLETLVCITGFGKGRGPG